MVINNWTYGHGSAVPTQLVWIRHIVGSLRCITLVLASTLSVEADVSEANSWNGDVSKLDFGHNHSGRDEWWMGPTTST